MWERTSGPRWPPVCSSGRRPEAGSHIQMSNLQSAADATRIPYVRHPGTGLERPVYSQAPRRGAEAGVLAKKL